MECLRARVLGLLQRAHPDLRRELALVVLRDLVFLAIDQAVDRARQRLYLVDGARLICTGQRFVSLDPFNFLFCALFLAHEPLERVEALIGGNDRATLRGEPLHSPVDRRFQPGLMVHTSHRLLLRQCPARLPLEFMIRLQMTLKVFQFEIRIAVVNTTVIVDFPLILPLLHLFALLGVQFPASSQAFHQVFHLSTLVLEVDLLLQLRRVSLPRLLLLSVYDGHHKIARLDALMHELRAARLVALAAKAHLLAKRRVLDACREPHRLLALQHVCSELV